jgi:radical SAM superfamily enzyme YgiQ (UPF0313 family)
MDVALVNTNRIKPPIAPIGLEYVAEGLYAAGHSPCILDLQWEDDSDSAVERFFGDKEYELVGVSIRNTDDCAFSSRHSFFPEYESVIGAIRKNSGGIIVIGGVGFSCMPEHSAEVLRPDAGLWGDGERFFADIATRIEKNDTWNGVPGLVLRSECGWKRTPQRFPELRGLPEMTRRWVDNLRYYREGGQIGVETKRGCPGLCIYCADPLAKGKTLRLRDPSRVASELKRLVGMGIDHFHLCDSEFNIPEMHAECICEELIRHRTLKNARWYTYCSPVPFSRRLAGLMRRAGCAGINFGVDSGDRQMLRRLRRNFVPEDIVDTVAACKEEGITVMLDLLLGSPSESEESIVHTIDLMKKINPDCVGVSVGVRVYPGTPIESMAKSDSMRDGISGDEHRNEPVFFIDQGIAHDIFGIIDRQIGNDSRFLFFDPSKPEVNYNYNANQRLTEAISKGYRGAYWDILRKYTG